MMLGLMLFIHLVVGYLIGLLIGFRWGKSITNWNHLVITKTRKSITLYFNGAEIFKAPNSRRTFSIEGWVKKNKLDK